MICKHVDKEELLKSIHLAFLTWVRLDILCTRALVIYKRGELIFLSKDRRGRDRIVVRFMTTMSSVPITTNVVSSNPVRGEVYSIQHYVIKFGSDLRQVGGFPHQ